MSWRESSAALKDGDFRKLVAAFSGGAGELAAAMSPGWIPGEAHLLGKVAAARRERDGVDPLDLRLAALERAIERRRRAWDGEISP